jgi:DNA-binding CsgD family transcriptional regulator
MRAGLGLALSPLLHYLLFESYLRVPGFRLIGRLELLQALGLDEAAGTVYKVMLAGRATEVSGLAARTGLPEAQVHAALEALAAANLVRASITPRHWVPVSSQFELAETVRCQEANPARRRPEIAAAHAAAAAYAAAHPASSHIEWLAGLGSARVQAENLIRTAKSELDVIIAAPQAADGWQASILLDSSGPATGVQVKALYHDSARDDPAVLAHAAQLAGSGFQARTTPDLPPVLMISDQHAALIPLDRAHPGNDALCIREPVIVAILAVMFVNAWNTATPLGNTAREGRAQAISAREQALLRYLAAGLTDEATARRLGISLRTTRRQVAALMVKLGASSRFQAGREAARRGWL